MKNIFLLAFSISFILQSCQNESIELKNTVLDLPSLANSSNDQEALGRVLFYDKQLSINNSVSCASCHKQQYAFSDNVDFSRGFENRLTTRNSMPIQNLSTNGRLISLFWDGRESNLSEMVLNPIVNHIEMGMTDFNQISNKLNQTLYYGQLFSNAFGSEEINAERIGFSLSRFVSSINSKNTKFDQAQFGDVKLTVPETNGFQLFFDVYDCNSCHQVQDPQGYIFAGTFANVGLDKVSIDSGLEKTTSNPFDKGKFKIPSLRNVALTAPYMHDGRFNTLEEVMGHYDTGIENNENLDPRLRNNNGTPIRLDISEQDKQDIIAFLNTLTDQSMISNTRLSNPFIKK